MNEEMTKAMNIIKQACGSVVADLDNHQKIQAAIMAVEETLTTKAKKDEKTPKA